MTTQLSIKAEISLATRAERSPGDNDQSRKRIREFATKEKRIIYRREAVRILLQEAFTLHTSRACETYKLRDSMY